MKNENVTEFRYALVESDDMPIAQQNALLRELELPIACLVHSGGKSLHAIVRIDAPDYAEYRRSKRTALPWIPRTRTPPGCPECPALPGGGTSSFWWIPILERNPGKPGRNG